jgi:hypothetical protein
MANRSQPEGRYAIIIASYEYQTSHHDLPGAKLDKDIMKEYLEGQQYKVCVIENKPDILTSVETAMEEVPDRTITHLHVHCVGEAT